MEHRVAHQSSVLPHSVAEVRTPLGAPSRFAPSLRRDTGPGPALPGTRPVASPGPASTSRRGHSAPRSGSLASREREYVRPQPAGAALYSISETSREDALT